MCVDSEGSLSASWKVQILIVQVKEGCALEQ